MKKFIYILAILIFTSQAYSHTSHYDGIKVINMEIFKDGEIIGYSNYFFERGENTLEVKNYTQFKVKLFGIIAFSISSEALEKYKNNKLISFNSITFQNDKEKYVNLNYDKAKNKFIIDGSSYKGDSEIDVVIGNWWNHKIIKSKKQISPLSGSIKEQNVTFIGKESIELYGKSYSTEHYKLKSKNQDLPKDKRLDFDIWLDTKNKLILKVLYHRMGEWEYRLKNFE
ncbi:hypothetical protein OAJ75_01655 [Candidatus Pelagibacter sp.]|nr:hypothetical protein [Candidatus Pelagibacter sp.]